MPHSDEEPIDRSEILYRRIPVSQEWYDPNDGLPPSPESFRPTKRDKDGISLFRARDYPDASALATNDRGAFYYVAAIRAADLMDLDIDIEPTRDDQHPGHVSIPGLRYENRKSNAAIEMKYALAEAVQSVEGPFGG